MNSISYNEYKSEDFIQDESFVQWVLDPEAINKAKWEQIKNLLPHKTAEIELARQIIITFQRENDQAAINEDTAEIWKKLQPVVRGESYNVTNTPERGTTMLTVNFWLKTAASLLLVSAFAFWYFQPKESQVIVLQEIKSIEKINPKGRRSTITLKDGSTVILNSESSLTYASNFGESVREVTLVGEAFFEVAKNIHKPFTVKSGKITTTALGTSFNISSFPKDGKITVSLATGKVKVEVLNPLKGSMQKPYLLNPGEQIKYSVDTQKFEEVRNQDDGDYLWKDGIISFKHSNLSDIVKKLERWYGVKTEIRNQPGFRVNYDGIFSNQSLDNVLKAMSFSLNFEYSIEEEKIKIKFN